MTVATAEAPAAETQPPAPNLARALRRGGRLLALALLVGSVVEGALHEATSLRSGVLWAGVFAIAGIILLFATAALLDVIFLRSLGQEVARGNLAAGIVAAGNQIAVGVVLDRCFYGQGLATLFVASVFFVIAIATLLLFQRLYRALTRFADDQEVVGENCAAAVAHVGVTVALAIIVGHAAEGEFLGWRASLGAYALALALAVALAPVRQIVLATLLVGKGPAAVEKMTGGRLIDRMVAEQRNLTVAAIEALAYVAVALLATGVA